MPGAAQGVAGAAAAGAGEGLREVAVDAPFGGFGRAGADGFTVEGVGEMGFKTTAVGGEGDEAGAFGT